MANSKILIFVALLIIPLFLISIIPAEPSLEKIQFIHYKDGHVKVVGEVGKPDFAQGPKITSCYKLMGIKWKSLPVNYVINPANPQNLSESFVTTAIYNGAEEWDANTASELFSSYVANYSALYGVQNYQNEISFGNYPDPGVIAVTTVWWSPKGRQIVEFDIEFDTDWTWGDATASNVSVMDLQNIATHELGHGIGLADLYDTVCSAETMYGYSNYGDIAKRTLNKGDIAGIKKIYG